MYSVVNLKTQTLKLFNHGKQEHLGQDPEHRDHRTHRHRHHLRGDILHGRVKIEEKAGTTLSAFLMKTPY